jgi:hypothetical protein
LYVLFFLFSITHAHAQISSDESILKEEWVSFSSQHPSLAAFSSEEITTLANQWGKKVAKLLSVSDAIRGIDAEAVEKLISLLEEDNPHIFMRHGEQQKTEQVQRLSVVEQKIEMMRLPDNIENVLTRASLAEWMEGMIVWEYLKQKTGRRFRLESSKNRRAEIPASALAYALRITADKNCNLNCVNYPSNDEMSNAEVLKWIPDGTLPWEKQTVDAVIGSGTYEHLTREMEILLNSSKEPNAIFIAITHTQQTNAIATLLDLPIIRLGNFGFILFTEKHTEMFPEGFYKK